MTQEAIEQDVLLWRSYLDFRLRFCFRNWRCSQRKPACWLTGRYQLLATAEPQSTSAFHHTERKSRGVCAKITRFVFFLALCCQLNMKTPASFGLANGLPLQLIFPFFFSWAAELHFCLEWDDLSVQVTKPPSRSITAQTNESWISSLLQSANSQTADNDV